MAVLVPAEVLRLPTGCRDQSPSEHPPWGPADDLDVGSSAAATLLGLGGGLAFTRRHIG